MRTFTIEQIQSCNKHLNKMVEIQKIFADINQHYKAVQEGRYNGNDENIKITIDNTFFVSYNSFVDHELICTLLCKKFERHLKMAEKHGVYIDAKIKDFCKEEPYFNRYGRIKESDKKPEYPEYKDNEN